MNDRPSSGGARQFVRYLQAILPYLASPLAKEQYIETFLPPLSRHLQLNAISPTCSGNRNFTDSGSLWASSREGTQCSWVGINGQMLNDNDNIFVEILCS